MNSSASTNQSIFIGVGSNEGNRNLNIENALELLASSGDVDILDQSSFKEYPAVEQCVGQAPFLNGVIRIKTELPALDLLHRLQTIERKLGRKSKGDGSTRSIDLDILSYEEPVVFSGKSLTLPHARMLDRVFVLEPLAEIAPHWIHPKTDLSVQSLLDSKRVDSHANQNQKQVTTPTSNF